MSKVDKIIQIASLGSTLYGLSESGMVYKIEYGNWELEYKSPIKEALKKAGKE